MSSIWGSKLVAKKRQLKEYDRNLHYVNLTACENSIESISYWIYTHVEQNPENFNIEYLIDEIAIFKCVQA